MEHDTRNLKMRLVALVTVLVIVLAFVLLFCWMFSSAVPGLADKVFVALFAFAGGIGATIGGQQALSKLASR